MKKILALILIALFIPIPSASANDEYSEKDVDEAISQFL